MAPTLVSRTRTDVLPSFLAQVSGTARASNALKNGHGKYAFPEELARLGTGESFETTYALAHERKGRTEQVVDALSGKQGFLATREQAALSTLTEFMNTGTAFTQEASSALTLLEGARARTELMHAEFNDRLAEIGVMQRYLVQEQRGFVEAASVQPTDLRDARLKLTRLGDLASIAQGYKQLYETVSSDARGVDQRLLTQAEQTARATVLRPLISFDEIVGSLLMLDKALAQVDSRQQSLQSTISIASSLTPYMEHEFHRHLILLNSNGWTSFGWAQDAVDALNEQVPVATTRKGRLENALRLGTQANEAGYFSPQETELLESFKVVDLCWSAEVESRLVALEKATADAFVFAQVHKEWVNRLNSFATVVEANIRLLPSVSKRTHESICGIFGIPSNSTDEEIARHIKGMFETARNNIGVTRPLEELQLFNEVVSQDSAHVPSRWERFMAWLPNPHAMKGFVVGLAALFTVAGGVNLYHSVKKYDDAQFANARAQTIAKWDKALGPETFEASSDKYVEFGQIPSYKVYDDYSFPSLRITGRTYVDGDGQLHMPKPGSLAARNVHFVKNGGSGGGSSQGGVAGVSLSGTDSHEDKPIAQTDSHVNSASGQKGAGVTLTLGAPTVTVVPHVDAAPNPQGEKALEAALEHQFDWLTNPRLDLHPTVEGNYAAGRADFYSGNDGNGSVSEIWRYNLPQGSIQTVFSTSPLTGRALNVSQSEVNMFVRYADRFLDDLKDGTPSRLFLHDGASIELLHNGKLVFEKVGVGRYELDRDTVLRIVDSHLSRAFFLPTGLQ